MKRTLIALSAVLALAACEEPNTYVEPPPPKVTVAAPAVMTVTDYLYFTGTTQASAVVDVRARVSGNLETMLFEPGSFVEAGDRLFVIDQREYIAAVEIAKAQLQAARAQKVEADAALQRAESLIQRGNISQAKLDEAEATARTATSEVAVREAALRQAELDLEYTDIRAPIDGRIGRNLVDVGNLVGESEPTHLATITASDPMYVYFNINERDLLLVMDQARGRVGENAPETRGDYLVEMAIGDQQDYPFLGSLDFTESALDPDTGTLQLRATFDNPGEVPELLSGLFARVRVPVSQRENMPLVTERAIGLDQAGRYVYVVGEDNTVEKRNVTVGQLVDGLRVIEEGLSADVKVVVMGIQRVRDGSAVTPEETKMEDFTISAMTSGRQQVSGRSAPAAEDTESATE
jgi:RND family efflux transporter MFP subunit